MRVVSNTTPILNLAIINHLELLHLQFEEVVIPQAVLSELYPESDLAGAFVIQQALRSGWLVVQNIQNQHLSQLLQLDLDAGESEAITLALDTNASLILMDEHDGRSRAKKLGLSPIGTVGILLKAKNSGHIKEIKPVLRSLQQEAGFYISNQLTKNILSQAGE